MGKKGALNCDLESPGSYKLALRRRESPTDQKAPEKPSSGIFPETQVSVCSPAPGNTTLVSQTTTTIWNCSAPSPNPGPTFLSVH